jgi:hypothetical protein
VAFLDDTVVGPDVEWHAKASYTWFLFLKEMKIWRQPRWQTTFRISVGRLHDEIDKETAFVVSDTARTYLPAVVFCVRSPYVLSSGWMRGFARPHQCARRTKRRLRQGGG